MTYPTDYADPYEFFSSEPEDYILANIERDNMNNHRHIGEWIIIDDCEKFIARCSICGKAVDSRCTTETCPSCKSKMISVDELIDKMEQQATKQTELALHINDETERVKHLYAEQQYKVAIEMIKNYFN